MIRDIEYHDNPSWHYKNEPQLWARRESNDLDINFDVNAIKKEVSPWRQFVDLTLGWKLTNSTYFNTICGLCLAQPSSEKDLYLFRKNGYRRLNSFIRRLSRREVHLLEMKLVFWCCLNLLTYFHERYRSSTGCDLFIAGRKARGSKDLLCHLLDIVMPENQFEVARNTILYFTCTCQWDFEDVVIFVFQKLLVMTTKQDMILTKLIKAIERAQGENNVEEAQAIAKNLAMILEILFPTKQNFTPKLQKCFFMMLRIYLLNDIEIQKTTNVNTLNIKFRVQIKNCIRHFISKVRDDKGLITMMDTVADIILDSVMPGDEKTDLVEMIAYCAQRLTIDVYRESFSPRILNFLLTNLKSDYRTSAMSSQRIFHYLLDRHDNLQYFTEPIYHFKGRSSFVVNADYRRDDVHFFKSFSQEFFSGMYKCLKRFTEFTSLVSSYTVICLVLVEIPDPVTTINMIHMVIKTQNNVLMNTSEFNLLATYHIHSIVASILSLICLIHEDEAFALTKYVREVVSFRNENSPHLLPPLRPDYHIATHHTTDYHQQLYFLEEEVLYALKQCWLGKRRIN